MAYAALLLVMMTVIMLGGVVAVVRVARKRLDERTGDAPVTRESAGRNLLDNWSRIEETGLARGMTPEELAEVRRKLADLAGA